MLSVDTGRAEGAVGELSLLLGANPAWSLGPTPLLSAEGQEVLVAESPAGGGGGQGVGKARGRKGAVESWPALVREGLRPRQLLGRRGPGR